MSSPSEQLWRAYDQANQFYSAELQLFASRMNLFFLVDSGFLAIITGAATAGATDNNLTIAERVVLGFAGESISVIWAAVAFSSYEWLREWRRQMQFIGGALRPLTGRTRRRLPAYPPLLSTVRGPRVVTV